MTGNQEVKWAPVSHRGIVHQEAPELRVYRIDSLNGFTSRIRSNPVVLGR